MLAYDYPLLGLFWTMLWFFLFVIWLIFVIIVPFLGVLIYVIARGHSMAQRDMESMQAQQQAFDSYVRQTAGSGSTAGELEKLVDLRDRGVITEQEFQTQKAKLLA
jgi:hypothetical protein